MLTKVIVKCRDILFLYCNYPSRVGNLDDIQLSTETIQQLISKVDCQALLSVFGMGYFIQSSSLSFKKSSLFVLPCVAAIGLNASSVLESASSEAKKSNLSPEVYMYISKWLVVHNLNVTSTKFISKLFACYKQKYTYFFIQNKIIIKLCLKVHNAEKYYLYTTVQHFSSMLKQ